MSRVIEYLSLPLMVAMLLVPPVHAQEGPTPVVVNSTLGAYEGEQHADLAVFQGIRYAETTGGANRWKAPVPAAAHQGTYKANDKSAICTQDASWLVEFLKTMFDNLGINAIFRGILKSRLSKSIESFGSEDCLFLNIRTPRVGEQQKLPVMVWLHGGAYQAGSGNASGYRSDTIPQQGVVLVTLNSRVGVLGYLAHPCAYPGGGNFRQLWTARSDRGAALGEEQYSSFWRRPKQCYAVRRIIRSAKHTAANGIAAGKRSVSQGHSAEWVWL